MWPVVGFRLIKKMQLFIEDNDIDFINRLNNVIENLRHHMDPDIRNIYGYIKTSSFTANFIKSSIADYRGRVFENGFVIHKTVYETYDSLCWGFFHELSHLIFMNSFSSNVLKCCKTMFYKNAGFRHPSGDYWNCRGWYDYYSKHHDEDPEEQIANLFATYIIGCNYDRSWWELRKKWITYGSCE